MIKIRREYKHLLKDPIVIFDGEVGNARSSWTERKFGELDGQLVVSSTKTGICLSTTTWEDICRLIDPVHPSLLLLSTCGISHLRGVRTCLSKYAQDNGCLVLGAGRLEVIEGSLDHIWNTVMKSYERGMRSSDTISIITEALCSTPTYEGDIFFASEHGFTWICSTTILSNQV